MQASFSMLSLGDSYTIGEAVAEAMRFPNQAVAMLKKEQLNFAPPKIIAKTGWTTDELAGAIQQENIQQQFDFVTLLIGVNNQYRQRDLPTYAAEFSQLLTTAIHYAGGSKKNVIVLSIPDWGKTPFVANDEKKRAATTITKEIDAFNAINKKIAIETGVNYIDITPHSRKMAKNSSFLATDQLHPSGKMYKYWAQKVAQQIMKILNKEEKN